jgi:hypothetical protein
VAVVEQHAAPQSDDIRQRIRPLEPLGKLRYDSEIVIDAEERIVEELMRLLRCFVSAHTWIEIDR